MPSPRHPLAKVVPLLLLLALAAGVALWLRPQAAAPAPAASPAADAPPPAQADAGAPRQPALATAPIAPAPLPSLGAPLALVVADLQARSDAGDPAAACRLAAEQVHCSRREIQSAELDRWLAEQQAILADIAPVQMRKTVAQNIERQLAAREDFIDRTRRHCEGVPVASPNDIARQWRRAALLGSPAAMRQYASGNAFRWGSLMDSLPLLATYRTEAEAMALRVARDGDAGMLLALAAGYDPTPASHRSLLAQSLAPDGARALAMYQRAQSAMAHMPEDQMRQVRSQLASRLAAMESRLSPEDRERARQLLAGELAGWAPLVFGEEVRQGNGSQPDVHRFACGAPPGETVRIREAPPIN